MRRALFLSTLLGLICAAQPAQAQEKKIAGLGTVSAPARVAGDFASAEALASDPAGNVYLVDNSTKAVFRLDPQARSEVFVVLGEKIAGIAYDPKGRLLVCLPDGKKIVAVDVRTKATTVVAEKFEGKPLEAPQDVAADNGGGFYFSDPPAGSVYYVAADGQLARVIGSLPSPGAVVLAPGMQTLYVVLQKSPIILAYPIAEPGKLKKGKVFANLPPSEKGGLDGGAGAATDTKGNLFVAAASGVHIFSPDGKALGSVAVPERPLDIAFGGDKRKTLHISTGTAVYTSQIVIPFDPYPLMLLVLGIGFIIGTIVWLRLHAFLALIGAALLVGLLSPAVLFVVQPDSSQPALELLRAMQLTAQAFGNLMGRIGLAIAFATIIGKAMMDSGAADRIVRAFTRLFGERNAGMALMVSGFILAIPVFFDNVFLLLVPLAKALYIRTKQNYVLYVTAIGAGGAVTHSLVPPTPGPIAMSEILHVDLGFTIIAGILIGFPVSLVGLAYASYANQRWPVALRQTGSVSLEEMERQARVAESELPPLGLSLTPILLPVLFITGNTVFEVVVRSEAGWNQGVSLGAVVLRPKSVFDFLGNSNVALLIAAVIAMVMVARRKRLTRTQMFKFTAEALDEAGMILLITCAGGAFGAMLDHVGVGQTLNALADLFNVPLLILAWGLAVLFKVAQGSGTVSMITSAGIVWTIVKDKLDAVYPGQPVTSELIGQLLGYHPVYLVMAIGVGSKVCSWMNDSGFWVVSKMGGLTETETLRTWTACLVVMGVFGLPLVWLLSVLLPLVGTQ